MEDHVTTALSKTYIISITQYFNNELPLQHRPAFPPELFPNGHNAYNSRLVC